MLTNQGVTLTRKRQWAEDMNRKVTEDINMTKRDLERYSASVVFITQRPSRKQRVKVGNLRKV